MSADQPNDPKGAAKTSRDEDAVEAQSGEPELEPGENDAEGGAWPGPIDEQPPLFAS